jgi:hypothetical protein
MRNTSHFRDRRATRLRRRQATPPEDGPAYHPSNIDTTFDVAIHHPIDSRDPHHWAIHVMSPLQESTIFQVHDDVGGRGYYVAEPRYHVQPQNARLHRLSIFIGRIKWRHLHRVRRFLQQWRVNNTSATWNCQSWVVEAIWALARRGWMQLRWRGVRRLIRMRDNWQ